MKMSERSFKFQILRAAEVGMHIVTPHSDLVSQAVLLIGDDNLSTAQQCIKMLTCLGSTCFFANFS